MISALGFNLQLLPKLPLIILMNEQPAPLFDSEKETLIYAKFFCEYSKTNVFCMKIKKKIYPDGQTLDYVFFFS